MTSGIVEHLFLSLRPPSRPSPNFASLKLRESEGGKELNINRFLFWKSGKGLVYYHLRDAR